MPVHDNDIEVILGRKLRSCGVEATLHHLGCLGAATEEPLTPEQRECRAEAQTSPGMKALDRQRMPMNSYNEDRLNREERVVLNRAYLDCLRARGLALPGGVQTVQPR